MRAVLAWLAGIVAGVVVAVVVVLLAAWAFGSSAELAPKMISISAIAGIAAGVHVGRRIKRRMAGRAEPPTRS